MSLKLYWVTPNMASLFVYKESEMRKMAESKFGVIHEIGDYAEFEELSDKDHQIVKEQYERRQQEEDKQKNHYRG